MRFHPTKTLLAGALAAATPLGSAQADAPPGVHQAPPQAGTAKRAGHTPVKRPPPKISCEGKRTVKPVPLELSSVVKLIDGKDTNLGNSSTSLMVEAWIRTTPKRVLVYGHVTISENDSSISVFNPKDNTTFRQDFEHVLYDAGECEIAGHEIRSRFQRVAVDATGLLSAMRKGDARYALKVYNAPNKDDDGRTQPLDKARCRLGASGDDKGKTYCDKIWFNKIEVRLRPERTECGSATVRGGNKLVFPLMHSAGDDEIGGSSRDIVLTGPTGAGGTIVDRSAKGAARLRGLVTVREMEGDRTRFSRKFSRVLLEPEDLPDHCEVGKPGSASDFEPRTIHAVRDHDWTSYPTTGKVRKLDCRTDSKGSDKNRTGCEITFGVFEVPLRSKQ